LASYGLYELLGWRTVLGVVVLRNKSGAQGVCARWWCCVAVVGSMGWLRRGVCGRQAGGRRRLAGAWLCTGPAVGPVDGGGLGL